MKKEMNHPMWRSVWAVATLFCLQTIGPLVAAPAEFRLGKEGVALNVTLSASLKENAEAQKVAEDLRLLLTRITGEKISAEAEGEGILLSVALDFPEIAAKSQLDDKGDLRKEDYLLRSSQKQLLVVGATAQALSHAAADLLHRWGYRRFFAGEAWEIVPRTDTLRLAIDEVQRPDFAVRDIWYSGNLWPGEKERYEEWHQWNRMGSGFRLNTRHAYNAIYARNREAFDAHPEYFAKNNRPKDYSKQKKFNAASNELLELVAADAEAWFVANPEERSISMEPSDLSGWDETGEASKTIGSPSNQAITIANAVARKVAETDRFVGLYAYNDHQYPPTIPVEPNVIVSFATRLLRPDVDLIESIDLWRKQGVRLFGIRDYSSVFYWDFAKPGRGLGGNLDYLSHNLKKYHDMGARFYSSEALSSWGVHGLGYYVAGRLLWNTQEKPTEVVADFIDKSFGKAAAPMTTFYSLMNGEDSVWVREVSTGDLYSLLLEAWDLAKEDKAVCTRIGELIAYIRYVELLNALDATTLEGKKDALRTVFEWVLRIAPMQMLPTETMINARHGLRQVYGTQNAPGAQETVAMTKAAQANPVMQEELLALARSGSGRALQAAPLPNLISEERPVASPWLRNTASFVFPLSAGDTAETSLTMRRFGFSLPPRYVVLDPNRKVIQRGRLAGSPTAVKLNAKISGNHSLVIEATPNLVKCSSPQSFFIMPDNGLLELVEYEGPLHFYVPSGVEAELVIGGQRKHERINFTITADNGEIVADEQNVNGEKPYRVALSRQQEARHYEIKIGKPDDGFFEDASVKFQGGFSCPVGLLPHAYGLSKELQ